MKGTTAYSRLYCNLSTTANYVKYLIRLAVSSVEILTFRSGVLDRDDLYELREGLLGLGPSFGKVTVSANVTSYSFGGLIAISIKKFKANTIQFMT